MPLTIEEIEQDIKSLEQDIYAADIDTLPETCFATPAYRRSAGMTSAASLCPDQPETWTQHPRLEGYPQSPTASHHGIDHGTVYVE
jgi:hypothetical protein